MTDNICAYKPVLYPLDQDLGKYWFIKYQTEDWVQGGFRYKKYTGLLNLVAKLQDRLQLAEQYKNMLLAGEPMPTYQGCRTEPAVIIETEKTNVVLCCRRYLDDLRTDDKAPATIAQYQSKLNLFYKWLKDTGRSKRAIGGIDDLDARDFMLYLKTDRQLCNHTWNAYKRLLGRIWDDYRRHIKSNPWKEIKSRKHKTVHLQSYPLQLQQTISENLPAFDAPLWRFVQCIYYLGIRPGTELRFIKLKYIDFEKGTLTVPAEIAKARVERTINIYYKLLDQLKEQCAPYLDNPDYYLFAHNGQPGPGAVSKNYWMRRWDLFRKKYDIAPHYKMYGSKHTGGKKLAMQSNLYVTQQHFGHTDPGTTYFYVDGTDNNELKFLQQKFPEFAA